MTKKIVKRTDANNETLYFYTHSDAVDVGEGSSMKSLTEVIDDTLHKSPQTLTNAEKTQVHANLGTESFVDDRAVRYDEAQVLGSSEKTQALVNLGLNGVDDVPTENSNNLVKSGGVHNSIVNAVNSEKERAELAEQVLQDNIDNFKDETLEENRQMVNSIMENYAPVEITGDVNNAADEEDLTSVNVEGTDVLKFKDKVYNPLVYSGLGRKILRKNIVNGVNTLTKEMMSDANTIYHIQYDYDLNGEEITIPEGCTLEFEGGSLMNGKLTGTLNTVTALDVKDIGLVYNSSAAANENVQKLKILEGITNIVSLKISDTLYLGEGNVNIQKSLSLEGGGNTIYVDEFGFTVSEDVSIRNCRFIGNSIYTASKCSVLTTIRDVICVSNIVVEDSYFEGNIRVVECLKVYSANMQKYVDEVVIKNNTFESITASPSAVIFDFSDVNFKKVNVANNKIHNFYGVIVYCATGDTEEQISWVDNFYQQYGRTLIVTDNFVFNDVDWRPWDKIKCNSVHNSYYCFTLIKRGECFYERNKVSNIIGNYSGTACYECYAIVDNLRYDANYSKNCINLTGSYNELLKFKKNGHKKTITNSTFIVEDLSEIYSDLVVNDGVLFMDTQSGSDDLIIIDSNIFNLQRLVQNSGNHTNSKTIVFSNNLLYAEKVGTLSGNASLLNLPDGKAIVENNTISFNNFVDGYKGNIPCIITSYSDNLSPIELYVNNNVLYNCIITQAAYRHSDGFVGRVSNNKIYYNAAFLSQQQYFIKGKTDNLIVDNNYIMLPPTTGQMRLCPYNVSKHVSIKIQNQDRIALRLYMINLLLSERYNKFGSMFKVIIEYYRNTTEKCISEVNVKIDQTKGVYSINEIKAYATGDQVIKTNTPIEIISLSMSENKYLLNVNTFNQNAAYYNKSADIDIPQALLIAGSLYDISVKIMSISSMNHFYYHPTSGPSSNRPGFMTSKDIGFRYQDKTLGKPIFVNSISADGSPVWVDATGANV